jgi:hypothetical protein
MTEAFCPSAGWCVSAARPFCSALQAYLAGPAGVVVEEFALPVPLRWC